MKLARRLAEIKPSPDARAQREGQGAGRGREVDIVAASPPVSRTSTRRSYIKDAAVAALTEGFTKYTATAGHPRAARGDRARSSGSDNELDFTPEQVLVSCGAKHSLYNCFQALLTRATRWSSSRRTGSATRTWCCSPGARRWSCPPASRGRLRARTRMRSRRALTPRTRAVVLQQPEQPDRRGAPEGSAEGLAAALRGHDCLVITDDIYERLLYTGQPFVEHRQRRPGPAARAPWW